MLLLEVVRKPLQSSFQSFFMEDLRAEFICQGLRIVHGSLDEPGDFTQRGLYIMRGNFLMEFFQFIAALR